MSNSIRIIISTAELSNTFPIITLPHPSLLINITETGYRGNEFYIEAFNREPKKIIKDVFSITQ
mgnify:CR=1 FL=1